MAARYDGESRKSVYCELTCSSGHEQAQVWCDSCLKECAQGEHCYVLEVAERSSQYAFVPHLSSCCSQELVFLLPLPGDRLHDLDLVATGWLEKARVGSLSELRSWRSPRSFCVLLDLLSS